MMNFNGKVVWFNEQLLRAHFDDSEAVLDLRTLANDKWIATVDIDRLTVRNMVWVDREGYYWPVVQMTERRLLALITFVTSRIENYARCTASLAMDYAARYEDKDWYEGDATVFGWIGEYDEDEEYLELLEWKQIFEEELARRKTDV